MQKRPRTEFCSPAPWEGGWAIEVSAVAPAMVKLASAIHVRVESLSPCSASASRADAGI